MTLMEFARQVVNPYGAGQRPPVRVDWIVNEVGVQLDAPYGAAEGDDTPHRCVVDPERWRDALQAALDGRDAPL